MKQNRKKDDQLVIPISLPEGLALRSVAAHFDITYASFVRQLIRKGILASDAETQNTFNQKLDEFEKLSILQLLQIKTEPLNGGTIIKH